MRKLSFLMLVLILLAAPAGTAAADGLGGWSSPAVASTGWWDWPSASSTASQVVFLDPSTSAGGDFYYDRRILFVEYLNGSWTEPITIGSNALYRPTGWGPITTHPYISADGQTIVYLGCTGGCKPITEADKLDVYISRRTVTGWSAPAVVPTGLSVVNEYMGLSADGSTLAFSSDYMNLPFYKHNQIFLMDYADETWGPVQTISADTLEGWSPILSRDGLKVVWVSNPPEGGSQNILMVSTREAIGSPWSAPAHLGTTVDATHNLGEYRFSADGNSVFYWKYTLLAQETYMVCVTKDLYVVRQAETGWSAEQKVTATPITPMSCDGEAPPAVDATGTRVIYSRTVLAGDSITGTFFEMTEYRNGAWTAPTAITTPTFPYYLDPQLSDNGARLVSLGPDTFTGGGALVWMQGRPIMSFWSNLALIIGAAR